LQVAADLRTTFTDGVFFIDLAPINNPTLVAATIAHVLSVKEVGSQSVVELLIAHLHDKKILLLLDNFEQVQAAAPLLSNLLETAGRLKLLVTSRVPLHLQAEHEFPVSSLQLPDPKDLHRQEVLLQNAAVVLFAQRAQMVRRDFQLTSENVETITKICSRLDGLPLSIELAASRSKILSSREILARLDRPFKLLTGGRVDMPARQQSLRNTLDWSYNLLETAEQVLFRRLGCFVGGFTLEAAEVICNCNSDLPTDMLDALQSLLDNNLLQGPFGASQEAVRRNRFTMLETIREYALELLVSNGEVNTISGYHANYYLALAETAAPELQGPDQGAWLDRLDREHDNLRAALDWAFNQDKVDLAARLCKALWRFWRRRGHLIEGRSRIDLVLAMGSALPDSLQASLLLGAGRIACAQSDFAQGALFFDKSLALYRKLGDIQGIAKVLIWIGWLATLHDDIPHARESHEESLSLAQQQGDKLAFIKALIGLGLDEMTEGDPAQAQARFEESIALAREQGDAERIIWSLNHLGDVARWQSNHEQAEEHYHEALDLAERLGNTYAIAALFHNLGHIALFRGNSRAARISFEKSLMLFNELGHSGSGIDCLDGLAGVAGAEGKPERAARLFGATEELRNRIGARISQANRVDRTRSLNVVRAQIDEEKWSAAWAEGHTMTLEQAITYALNMD
jgi:predicted ATPase